MTSGSVTTACGTKPMSDGSVYVYAHAKHGADGTPADLERALDTIEDLVEFRVGELGVRRFNVCRMVEGDRGRGWAGFYAPSGALRLQGRDVYNQAVRDLAHDLADLLAANGYKVERR